MEIHDFRFLQHCKWDLRSSGTLCCVDWQLGTHISQKLVGPILKGQAVKETLVANYQSTLHNVSQEWRSQRYFTLCVKFPSTFLLLQLRETSLVITWLQGWTKGMFWQTQTDREREGADVCWEFCLINCMIQMICKNRSKLLVCLSGIDREWSYFEGPYKVTLIRRCLSGFSNTEVTIYQWAVLFPLFLRNYDMAGRWKC
jgi:hypothetical protein